MRNGKLKIGEAARLLGMKPRTIRFYESAGLLPHPKRTEHGYASPGQRLFSSADLRRLGFVKQARLLDLSLGQILELMEATEEGCCPAARPQLKTLIRAKLPELRRRIAELRQLERRLRTLLRTLPDEAPWADRSCDGTVDRCVPLESQPLLQISLPPARHARQRTQ